MNFHDLDNFNLADAVKFHSRLNPRIWGSDEHLLPEVREKLLEIADYFQEFLGVDNLKVQDITISGSNAAYSYTRHSDIDLHLVVDMPDDPVYQELFNAKKYEFNDSYNLKIAGVPVELYVQPADQEHHSQGIYSIKNNDWNQVPQRRRAKVDDSCVQHKTADLDARIHAAVESGDADAINRLWDRIKTMRQTGLEQNGEFGCENITFKLLRNMGCIGRLKDAKTAIRDRELSLEQSNKPRKRMNYGMRDYWFPGTAYAGQDHPAGTESEQVDEAVGEAGSPKVYAIGDSHGEGLSYTPGIINYAHGGQPSTSSSNYSGDYKGHPTGIDNVPDGSFVVISQGCNDAANSSRANLDSKGKIPLVSPDTIANNVVRLVNAALAKRCKVVVVLFPNGDPNTRPYYGGPYQEKVRQAIKASVGVPVIDLEGSPLADGVHAVPSAYKAAGSKVLSIFKTINEASSVPESSLDSDHLKKILHRFYKSCVSKLELENPPRLRLETTPDWSKDNGSFGQYEPETNTLILATYGRHVLDILRTMAHEMTHRQQDESEPLPADAGETGSPWEDQANAMAGRIMRDWAQEQPEMFDGATLEEASGYIPTRKQARDPRFVMALTKDVQPGAVGKEANKLGLETDSQGHPALLTAGLNKLLREFKEQDLFEINMGGKNLRREAAKTGALAGMEFEMIVPDTSSEDDELEPDFDSDERASSTRDIQDFFYDGDYNGRRNAQELVDRMLDDYGDWQVEQFDTRWDSDAETFIYNYLKENVDEDSIRELFGLEPEDDLGKKEYQLAADKIATEQLEPFYSDALEYSREEYYENDNFEEWLSDADLTHMSDIFHRYNGIIHWPHYTSSLAGGTSVEDVADSFSQAVGRPVKASSGYHSSSVERPAPGKNFYVVEPDGSLEPDDPQDSGLEFVSPPLPIDDIMSDLKKVKKWADQTGCYTNDSTGLHINISVPDYDLDKLDFVKLALLMGDEYVLEQFGRVSNNYAKSAMVKVRDHVKKRPFEAKYLLDKMKSQMGALASKAIHSGSTEKYTSINTKDGHVEFRSPGGDWLGDNFDKIENTLLRFTVALSAAMDPAAYREEYLKKLYKILNAGNNKGDLINMFARYSAGQLPAAALKSFVRQAQAERKTQKDIKNSKDMSLWKVVGSSNLPTQARGLTVKARNELEAFDQAAKVWNLNPELREKDYYEFNGWTAEKLGVEGQYAIVRRDDPRIRTGIGSSGAPDYLFRLSLPPDPTQDQMREALQAWASQEGVYMGDYMIVDTTRYSAPAQSAGASATEPHPEGRGRPNDPTGRYAITRRDDQRNYGNHVGSEAPDYQFRFTLPDGYSQAQMRSVLSAWAARNAVNAEDYMIVDTTQFAAPASAPEAGSVQWNIVADDGDVVHTFWNRNVQADANAAALAWIQANWRPPLNMAARGPFEVVPVPAEVPAYAQTQTYEIYDREDSSPLETFQAANDAAALEFLNQYRSMGPHTLNSQQATAAFGVRRAPVPGSTLDLQRQRQRDAALAAASMAADAEHAANRRTPTPIPGVQDIEPDVAQYTSQPAAAPQWEVYRRSDGVSMFPLDAATQAAAWAEGRQWVQQTSNDTGITLNPADYSVRQRAAVTESVTVIEQRLRQQLDALGNQAPTGPESPPKMPAGTIKVDVSDMYDWYKLGQNISDLSSIDKSTLGKGPPNTVFAFGSEELENMYSHELTNLGLKTHDLDEPGEEDVDESREITKFGKLDSVLEKCIEMIHRGHESDPEKYGRVAACLIDNKNNHTYAINMPGPDGTRRHAERMAIDKHLENHGRIGPNAIMITTLSPCVNHMDERYGESCTDLLSDYGIEKCYAGWQDPTQQPAEDYPFNLKITDNADIFNTCRDIAASFLPQAMTDELNETVNPDCFDPAFNDTQHFDGLTYRATVDEEYGKSVFVIRVLDDNFQQVGLAKFKPSKKGLVSLITSFRPEYQGQGIARNIYAYVRMLGNTIVPSKNQLPPGKAMWAAWKKSGDAKHLMRESASEREIAQVQYMQGECAVLALTIHKMDPQRFPLGFVYEFFDAVPDMYIEPDEFDELDPARQQDIQYSYQNWTLTHAYVYDVKTQEYIDAEGRHKELPTIGRDLNTTRHNKFPAEIQDLVRVSHYMEWDEAQEKWIVLQGWDAVDKAYTPEDKQRAREYAIKYLGIDQPAQAVAENFADGRNPQDKGDAKRHGINTKASVSSLRKTAKQGGRKGQLAHWLANMKAGRAKKNKTNEDTVATINLGDIIVTLDDHALDRQQQRGIDNKSFDSAIRKLKLPRVIKQMSQLEVGNRFYVLDHTTNVALGMRKIGDVKYVLKTVYVGRPADYNIAEIITV